MPFAAHSLVFPGILRKLRGEFPGAIYHPPAF
jgi:hypothetical protein